MREREKWWICAACVKAIIRLLTFSRVQPRCFISTSPACCQGSLSGWCPSESFPFFCCLPPGGRRQWEPSGCCCSRSWPWLQPGLVGSPCHHSMARGSGRRHPVFTSVFTNSRLRVFVVFSLFLSRWTSTSASEADSSIHFQKANYNCKDWVYSRGRI